MTGAEVTETDLQAQTAPVAAPAAAASPAVTPTPAIGPRAWANSTFVAFQFPVYRILWLGSFIGFLAFNMTHTAQSVVAYDLTGSNSAVGTVMFGQGVAMLLLNPFGGAIADRFNKRFLIILTQVVIGGTILATAVLLLTDRISIFLLASGSFLTGAMFAFLGPARASLVADVVSPQRIGNGMALLQVGGNFGRILAPFCAGALLSWAVLGAAGTYFVVAAFFLVVLAFMSRLPSAPPRPTGGRSVLDDVRLGLRYVRENKRLLHSLVTFYCITALGFSFMVVMPGFVKDDLQAGTGGLGIMLGVAAAGGFIGSVIVASLADSKRAPIYLKVAGAVVAVSLVIVGFMPGFVTAALVMVVVAAGIAAFQTLNNAVALKQADPAYYGRIMGLMQIAWGLINLVALPTGIIADVVGERTVLSGAGLALGVILLLLYLWERRTTASQQVARAAA